MFDPDTALLSDMVPAQDAQVQEHLLVQPLLQQAQRGELWIADCNFSTRAILGGSVAQGACFIVREHGAPTRTPRRAARCARVGASTRGWCRSSPW
ncbi:hypothetical protein [Azohydromonas caseinilytica]|uniref:hypothetical protein n=1 Tax=Azohydromonas caseinilytica TaxID=2728836 RepID=UPI00145D96FC|nr:hypothetical protein [Azohydromonas caseinilytica]